MNFIRVNAAQCDTTSGNKSLTIERNPVDPDYSDAKKNGLLCLSRPIYLYSIRPIDVTSVEIINTVNNDQRIEFNHDPRLRLDIANIEDISKVIPVPSAATVKAAIEKFERSNREDITIFTDYEKLLREVIALNLDEKRTLNDFLARQMKFCGTLATANETEIAACKVALKEIGIDVNI